LLKLTTERCEASRDLSAIAELLVCFVYADLQTNYRRGNNRIENTLFTYTLRRAGCSFERTSETLTLDIAKVIIVPRRMI